MRAQCPVLSSSSASSCSSSFLFASLLGGCRVYPLPSRAQPQNQKRRAWTTCASCLSVGMCGGWGGREGVRSESNNAGKKKGFNHCLRLWSDPGCLSLASTCPCSPLCASLQLYQPHQEKGNKTRSTCWYAAWAWQCLGVQKGGATPGEEGSK